MGSIAQGRKTYSCFNAQSRYSFQFCRGQVAVASNKTALKPKSIFLTGKIGIPKTTNRKQLAVIFECDVKTIYNEIKRGTIDRECHIQSASATLCKKTSFGVFQ